MVSKLEKHAFCLCDIFYWWKITVNIPVFNHWLINLVSESFMRFTISYPPSLSVASNNAQIWSDDTPGIGTLIFLFQATTYIINNISRTFQTEINVLCYSQRFVACFRNVFRVSRQKCSVKKVLLKISQISQENTYVEVFLNKVTSLKAWLTYL